MIIVLTGETGSGKTALSLELAKAVNGEIVCADAFQVYKEMPIATCSPTIEERENIPHHLFDYVSVVEKYDIARYQTDCRGAIKEILSRGKTPILVGGSGLYIRSAIYDYSFEVDTTEVDLSLYEQLDDIALHKVLEELDKEEAKKIPYQNRRRVLRAISLIKASGMSKTELLSKQSHEPIYETKFFALSLDRDELRRRIALRTEKMFSLGLENEAMSLLESYDNDLPALKAIGIKEFIPFKKGEMTLDEVKEAISLDTIHYAKRQRTFYRHQFPVKEITSLNDILEALS